MRMLKTLTIGISGAVLLAACSSTPTSKETTATTVKAKPAEVAAKPADPRAVGTVNAASASTASAGANDSIKNRSVYFDFDSYVLKPEFTPAITENSKYLTSAKSATVVIQGNTDERGGSEYNLALGQKRAEAVRKALVAMGVPSSHVEAISFGKEKPKATGSNEAAWAENRRADIVHPK